MNCDPPRLVGLGGHSCRFQDGFTRFHGSQVFAEKCVKLSSPCTVKIQSQPLNSLPKLTFIHNNRLLFCSMDLINLINNNIQTFKITIQPSAVSKISPMLL